MAICSATTRKLDVPGEEGQWIEVRPVSAKLIRALDIESKAAVKGVPDDERDAAYGFEFAERLLKSAIVAWSYDVPVTPENVEDLDVKTEMWLVKEVGSVGDVPLPTSGLSTMPLTE